MLTKKYTTLLSIAAFSVLLVYVYLYSYNSSALEDAGWRSGPELEPQPEDDGRFQWASRQEHFPVATMISMPSGKAAQIPSIQHKFAAETNIAREERVARQEAVKHSFMRAWDGYKAHAWMKDELAPLSGGSRNHFGGWAATLVDSLDSLWILGLKSDFEEAVASLDHINFTTTNEEEINTFETTIRYMGGLLAAYDLSGEHYKILLKKAIELGDMLYAAFDTPNRMPITRWHWEKALAGEAQEADNWVLLAEIGSLSLEFTRLSQLSGDPKFFDAIQRINDVLEDQQPLTKMPGLWPVAVDARTPDFTKDSGFTLGAMADSVFEYLPKQHMLLGGLSGQYRKMYENAIDAAKEHLFFRPMTLNNADILISGNAQVNSLGEITLDPQGQHLACYTGGMMGIASKIFDRAEDLAIAQKLVDGCIWAYQAMPSGIMPETFHVVPCEKTNECDWEERTWLTSAKSRDEAFSGLSEGETRHKVEQLRLVPGFTDIPDRRYILRPEAIESVFIMYRITGDPKLQDAAWDMFQAIEKHTMTEFGSAALNDITADPPTKSDSMESFWTAETLKYFYLIFSTSDVVSLDQWVFNTEAHPFKRPVG